MHVCGKCKKEFDSESKYLKHKCSKTGFTPKDQDHQGEWFKKISEKALERGAKRKNK